MGSMSEHPDRDRVAADEQRIGALLRAVEAPAPAAPARSRSPRSTRAAAPRRRRPRGARRSAFAGAFAAAASRWSLVLRGGRRRRRAVGARRLAVALERPTGPAPRTARSPPARRSPSRTGPARGWPSAGVRRDRLGGRTVTTEFYRSYDGRHDRLRDRLRRAAALGRRRARRGARTASDYRRDHAAAARRSSPGSRTATPACSPRAPHRRRRWCALAVAQDRGSRRLIG